MVFVLAATRKNACPLTHRQEAGICNCSLILFPDKNAPRCAANFAFWLTRMKHLVAAQFFCRSRRSAALCPQILPRRIKKTARSAQTVFLLFAISSLSVMALRHLNPHIHQHIRQKLAARRARLVRRGTPPHQRAVHRYVLFLPRLVDRRANRLIHPDGRGVALLCDHRVHLARHQSRLKRAIHQQQQRFHQIVEPRQPRGTPRHRSRLAIYHRIGVPGLGTGSGGS
mgnify:CR=1 FL=1